MKDINQSEFEKLLAVNKQMNLFCFTGANCPYCQQQKQILEVLEQEKSVAIYCINVDANIPLAQRLKIRGIPMIMVYFNGKKLKTYKGLTQLPELLKCTDMRG